MSQAPNAAFMRPLQPDPALAKIVGSKPLPRTEITKKFWAYIVKHRLQDKDNRRNINSDANLRRVFGGKKSVNIFEVNKLVSRHVLHFVGRPKTKPTTTRKYVAKQAREDDPIRDYEKERQSKSFKVLSKTTQKAIIDSRLGQGQFRERVLRIWKGKCAVTGARTYRMLQASHIKPWKKSSNKERLDGNNGLLLVPNLDKAFDRGFITFDDSGRIKVSARLPKRDAKIFGISRSLKLSRVPAETKKYLSFHRKHVFK
jgi:predicted restriction endonuclease